MKQAKMSVEYIDHMGSDLSVVNAARVSFAKESEWEHTIVEGYADYEKPFLSQKDEKLINYLAKHNHWTPFAHTSISLRIKAPIFVARQLGKHQVGLVWNEVSRRYVDEEPEFYFPEVWRGKPVNAKQGSDGVVEDGPGWDKDVKNQTKYALATYQAMIEYNIAPEQARMVLPQNTMTEWVWSGSLAAFCRVCKLRLDPHSQKETQEVAAMIKAIVEPLYPVSARCLLE